MDLNLSAEDLAFRDEVRTFLDENLTEDMREASRLTPAVRTEPVAARAWGKVLGEKGWLAHSWPTEYGGPGWDVVKRYIWELELQLADAPTLNHMGTKMVGPVIMKHGSPEQKEHYLEKIRKDELVWCQGYSEPGAGSDLASLQTRAVRDGDEYVINGSKCWTTGAHLADHMFCLVRTSTEGKRQEGISFLVFSMDRPGITIKPVLTFAGDHEFNEVFFDDVRVPVSCRVGEENKGWTVAKYLLEFERGGNFYSPMVKGAVEKLAKIAKMEPAGGGRKLIEDDDFRQKLASLDVRATASEMTEKRVMSQLSTGQNPGPASSTFKLSGSEIYQDTLEAVMKAIAYYMAPYQPAAYNAHSNVDPIGPGYGITAAPQYFNKRAATIYAGSSEVQHEIIAKHVLGL